MLNKRLLRLDRCGDTLHSHHIVAIGGKPNGATLACTVPENPSANSRRLHRPQRRSEIGSTHRSRNLKTDSEKLAAKLRNCSCVRTDVRCKSPSSCRMVQSADEWGIITDGVRALCDRISPTKPARTSSPTENVPQQSLQGDAAK